MNFLTTTLPLHAYLFTFAVFVTLLSYMYKTALNLVSVAAALISHETNRYSYKKKENILTYLTFICQQTRILPLAKRGIAWQRTLKPIRGIYRKSLLRVFVLKT